MHRRKFLTATGATLLANHGWLRAYPMGKSIFALLQPHPANAGELREGQPVNLFQWGRIQSWMNPEVNVLLESSFAAQHTTAVRLGDLTWNGPEFDVGVEWPEPRAIETIIIRFSGSVPAPDSRWLEIWEGLTGKQGEWKVLSPGSDDKWDGATWTVQLPATRAFKVRLRVRDKGASLEALEVRSPSRWKTGQVHIEWGHQLDEKSYRGHFEVYNGEILAVAPLGGTSLRSETAWTDTAGNGKIGGVAVTVLYTFGLDVDRTILTLRDEAGDFSFLPREALEEQPIYIPDFGVFIRNSVSSLSLDQYREQHKGEFRIADTVAKLPEQTIEQAYQHIHANRVVAFVGVDSNSQKFGIGPAGQIIVGYDDPKFGRIIKPRFTVHFDHVELPTVFDPPEPTPTFLFQNPTDKQQYLVEGWLPIVVTEWGSASDITYERTDFAALPRRIGPLDQSKLTGDELSVMISRLCIRNNSPAAKTIHFYIKPWKPTESSPYGPIPDGAKEIWQVMLKNRCIMVSEGYAQFGICAVDTAGKGNLAMVPVAGSVRYSLELNGDETHEIHMVIPGRPVPEPQIDSLNGLAYQDLYETTLQYWKARLAEGMQVEVPDQHVQNLYNANLQHFLVSLTKDPSRDEYYPNTAPFYYGAIGSESSPIIQALDMRGLHKLAERCLRCFLSTQGDAVPEGEYREPDGGFYHYWPWYSINQGFVLWALGEHYFYSGDKEWLRAVAPQIVSGCEFIVKGRKLTKVELSGGKRPISFGFAPAGTIGDPQSWKYSFMISGFFYLGLKKCAEALKDVDPENATRLEAEAADFLSAIREGLKESTILSPVARLRDGTSVPATPPFVTSRGFTSDVKDNVDPDPRFSYASDCVVGALQMVKCEVLGANDRETDWILNILEDRFFMFSPHQRSRVCLENISSDWFNLGGFDKMQPYYLGYPDVYLQRDQIPNFLRAFFNTLASIADPQNLSFQEELGGNGAQPQKTHEEARFLQQLRIMLLMESGQDLYLARGTPRSWLEHGKQVVVSRAPSYFGDLSFRIHSFADEGRIHATLQPPLRRIPAHIYLRLRHPKAAQLNRVLVNGRRWSDLDAAKELISLPTNAGEVEVQAYY